MWQRLEAFLGVSLDGQAFNVFLLVCASWPWPISRQLASRDTPNS